MRKYSIILVCSIAVIAFGCDNAEYVGTWKKEYAVYAYAPIVQDPQNLILNADYSFHSDGSYVSWGPPYSGGTYSLSPDSIILGNDSLERFKVTEITSTHLTIERYFYDSCDYNMTVRYIKQ